MGKNILYIAGGVVIILLLIRFLLWVLPIVVVGLGVLYLYKKGIFGNKNTSTFKENDSSKGNNVIDVDYKDAK